MTRPPLRLSQVGLAVLMVCFPVDNRPGTHARRIWPEVWGLL